MTPLKQILGDFREASKSEREKGTYFEDLTITYLKNEATYKDLYSHVWTYSDWAQEQGRNAGWLERKCPHEVREACA